VLAGRWEVWTSKERRVIIRGLRLLADTGAEAGLARELPVWAEFRQWASMFLAEPEVGAGWRWSARVREFLYALAVHRVLPVREVERLFFHDPGVDLLRWCVRFRLEEGVKPAFWEFLAALEQQDSRSYRWWVGLLVGALERVDWRRRGPYTVMTSLLFFFFFLFSVPSSLLPPPTLAAVGLPGTSGLLTIPTAEVIADGRWAWGMSYIAPGHYIHADRREYRIFPLWMTFGYLPFLEMSLRLTVIPDASPPAKNIGVYKDGMGSFHARVVIEGSWRPAIGVGVRDAYGYAQFPARYAVLTKTINIHGYRTRVHLGQGVRWLGGRYGVIDDPDTPTQYGFVGMFGGVDVRVRAGLTGMAEYDTRHINAGVRWHPVPHTQIDIGIFGLTKLIWGIAFDVDLL